MSKKKMKFIVVDEFDNVFGYYENKEDAIAEASCEYENGERATYVYEIKEIASFEEGT